MCISTPSMPDMPPPPPPPSPKADPQVQKNIERERKRLAAAFGKEDTILTSGKGLLTKAARTAKKSILGGA